MPTQLEHYVLEDQAALDTKIEEMRAAGFEVVVSDPQTLMLDLDTEEAIAAYEARRDVVRWIYGFEETGRWYSKSGPPSTHVVLTGPITEPAVRIALQAVLGSDWRREVWGLRRVLDGISPESLLSKPPTRPTIDDDVPF